MTQPLDRTFFLQALRRALMHLYDPDELRRSPLIEIFGLRSRNSPAAALQRLLLQSIEALEPDASMPPMATAWRVYRILFHRYKEQCTHAEVAATLGLSERQLRREAHLALRVLADYLLERHAPADASVAAAPHGCEVTLGTHATPTPEQELAWLRRSLPAGTADLPQALDAVLTLVRPLLATTNATVECNPPPALPRLALVDWALRQILLNAVTPAIHLAADGVVRIDVRAGDTHITLELLPTPRKQPPPTLAAGDSEKLEMATQLATLCGGSFAMVKFCDGTLGARLVLPIAERRTVLVIDDNQDTLLLFERCLAGTRYSFLGVTDPEPGFAFALRSKPHAVVLDLMLAGGDGWETLARFREHPHLRDVPIVVCSIIPQQELALALGAAAFLRKPVTRETLLDLLDRLTQQAAQ
ncbi:MAG: response regulator [Anaerolineae bacterium]|nr:response regulator [Anaerolineae bacterium]